MKIYEHYLKFIVKCIVKSNEIANIFTYKTDVQLSSTNMLKF